jgi:lysozyme family protein
MSAFARALPTVLATEGGYTDDPNDPGGPTNRGITQRVYDDYLASKGRGSRPVKQILDSEVRAIYFDRYWTRGKCDPMPWPISLMHFDGCVNIGVTGAAKVLQRAAGVRDDGVVGPFTIYAVEQADPHALEARLLWERTDYYRQVCNKRAASKVYLLGWLNRLADLRKAGGA